MLWPAAAYEALRNLPRRPAEYWLLEESCLIIGALPFQDVVADASVFAGAGVEVRDVNGFTRVL
jgi:hypothetical protein